MDQFIQLAVWASPQRPCQVGCAWRIGSSLATLAALCLAPSALQDLQASKNQQIKYLSESRRPSPKFHPIPMVYSSLSMFIIIVPYFLNEKLPFCWGYLSSQGPPAIRWDKACACRLCCKARVNHVNHWHPKIATEKASTSQSPRCF